MRFFRIILPVIFFLLVFSTCNKRDEKKHQEDKSKYGGTLRLMQDVPYSLDPLFMRNVYESTILNQIFNGLLDLDDNLNIVPDIAKYWEISGDRKIYKFYLQDNVFFHNGRKVTAKDFVYTFKRILNFSKKEDFLGIEYLQLIEGAQDFLNNKTKEISGLKIIDSLTLEIILTEPCTPFLTVLSMNNFSVVPKEEVENNPNFSSSPVGTGPFKFSSWKENEYIILEAYEKYFEGRPFLDTLIFYIPQHFTYDEEIDKFIRGELDVTYVSSKRLGEIKNSKRYKVFNRPELSIYFLGINRNIAPFNDEKLRKAIFYAIDNKKFDVIYGTSRLSAHGFIPPGLLGYDPAHTHKYYNLDSAKKFLEEFKINFNGKIPRLKLFTVSGNEENEIKKDLAGIGLEVDVVGLKWIELTKSLDKKSLPMFTLGWVADFPDPDAFFYSLIHSSGSANFFHLKNKKIDSLLVLGKKENNTNYRVDIYQKIEKELESEAVIIPLYYGMNTVATHNYVNDFNITSLGFMNINLKKVWIQK